MNLKASKRLLRTTFVLVGCFIYSFQTQAQAPSSSVPWGSWFVGTVQLPGGKGRWGGFLEAQARMNGVFRQFNYYEVKGGVSYDIGETVSVLVGTGRYHTYNRLDLDAGPITTETRLWQQLTLSQYLYRLKFEHRYRIEQRWFNHQTLAQESAFGPFRNRLRYRFNLLIPVNKPTIEAGTFFVSLYDEVFLSTFNPHFERNRLHAGLGYQLDNNLVLQAGWLNQFDYAPIRGGGKNNLIISLLYRLHPPGERPKLPTPVD